MWRCNINTHNSIHNTRTVRTVAASICEHSSTPTLVPPLVPVVLVLVVVTLARRSLRICSCSCEAASCEHMQIFRYRLKHCLQTSRQSQNNNNNHTHTHMSVHSQHTSTHCCSISTAPTAHSFDRTVPLVPLLSFPTPLVFFGFSSPLYQPKVGLNAV